MPFIEVAKLTKTFKSVVALEDVSLAVDSGAIVGIMGANGAGKSTLLRILAGLVMPSLGVVRVAGVNVAKAPREFRRRIGFAAGERPGFYDRLTGRQNLEFFAALYGLSGKQARLRIDEALNRFAMTAPEKPYQMLSSGMKQRLLLARVMLHGPSLLLLDEPTKSLDAQTAEHFLSWLKEDWCRRQGKTAVLATPQRAVVEQTASRILVLEHGRLIL